MNAASDIRWAALFPGQGSQSIGMGRELAGRCPAAAETFHAADEILGEPLTRLIFEGPEEALRLTRNTQPALLTVAVAAWRALAPLAPPPAVAAGHSLGEYSALVAAGVLSFDDALRAVRIRGEAMQRAVRPDVGAMAAVIGLDATTIDALCLAARQGDEVLVAANDNAPDQIVVAGHKAAVERLAGRASAAGAKKVVPLAVSAPFHCSLMGPAAEELAAHLATVDFGDGRFPVVANVDAAAVRGGDAARRRLVEQVTAPVRWVRCARAVEQEHGATLAVEIGPGRVLAGLSRRINERLRVVPCGTPEELERAVQELTRAPAEAE